MKKHFLLSENGSEVFWQIELSGYSLIVSTTGKTGSFGECKILNFKNREQCLKAFQKLEKRRLELGFQESDRVPSFKPLTGNPNYKETWKKIIASSNQKQALRDHFRFLIETEECKSLWEQILDQITEVKIDDENRFVLTLPWASNEETPVHLCWNPPYLGKIHPSVPGSMARFVSVFNGIEIFHGDDDIPTLAIRGVRSDNPDKPAYVEDDYGWEGGILEDGWCTTLELVEMSLEYFQDSYDECQNWLAYHPFIKNKYREPGISNVDHGSCELESPTVRYGFGGFLLREICAWVLEIDSDADDVMGDYTRIWKDTIEKSVDRLAENFQENKERYQREFNKILEYKDKGDEKEKTTLSNLGMQMSSAAFNRFLRENKPDAAEWVLRCYKDVYRFLEIDRNSTVQGNETGNSYNTAEYFAGDIIVFITKYNESQYVTLLEDLLPSDIRDARLAFNLACLNSLEKNKPNLLHYTKLALRLGKPKKDFEDSDFDNFKDDPEFHSLIALL
ncbi:WGR domain-containing protein [Leptospira santarosai]|uniref:WGR domain-containing protein n=1 Tax=Leptospira santarosai TaxID=28183 RepID=UPI0007743151|nr:WGR domain-containing protein [Leptospira santarosai]